MIFCPNFSNKQVKQEFEELVQAVGEDMAYLLWDRNNGYALDKAPNGADSRLFKALLDYYEGDRQKALQIKGKVYLQQFKDWFGDWQSEDKTNVSKVTDENGEPVLQYHTSYGSEQLENNSFRNYQSVVINKRESWIASLNDYLDKGYLINIQDVQKYENGEDVELVRPNAVYTTDNKEMSLSYAPEERDLAVQWEENDENHHGPDIRAEQWSNEEQSIYDDVYDRIHGRGNLLPLSKESEELIKQEVDKEMSKRHPEGKKEFIFGNPYNYSEELIGGQFPLFINLKHPLVIDAKGHNWNDITFDDKLVSTRDLEAYARENQYDGVIIYNVVDYGPYVRNFNNVAPGSVIESFSANQLKSVESTNFNQSSNNIYAENSINSEQSDKNIIKNSPIFNRLQSGSIVYSSEIFDEFIQNGIIPSDIRTVVNILARHNVAVMYTPIIDGWENANAIAKTVDGKRVIIISESGINQSSEQLLRTLVHEVVHSLTTEELNNNPNGQLAKQSNYLYNKYKDTFKAYGFKNVKEFVAEFVSKREFRDRLFSQAVSAEYKGILGKLKYFVDSVANMLCKKIIFGKNIKEYRQYRKNLIDYLNNKEQIILSGAENTQQLNEYLQDVERLYFINKENEIQNKTPQGVTDILIENAQRGTTPTDEQLIDAELNSRERNTPDFDEDERRQINVERRQMKVSDKMRKVYKQAKEQARKTKEFITYRGRGLRTMSESALDETVTKIIEGTISKDKAYRQRMKSESLTTFQERQIVNNQEAVREIKKRHSTIMEAQRSRQAGIELLEKLELFVDFIQHANDEISDMYKMLRNARANRYRQIYYKTANNGRRIYTDENGNQFTVNSEDTDLSVDEFGFDELQYANTDVVGYYNSIISEIVKMLDDINDMLPTNGSSEQLELNNQISAAYNTLKSLIVDTGIVNNMNGLKNLYSRALQERVSDLINQIIDEQDAVSLTPDMKQRMKITAQKWLKNQNDFGDVGVWEKWIGIGTRSKSSVVRIVQELINNDWDSIQRSSNEVGHNLGSLYQKALNKFKNVGYKFGYKNFAKRLMAVDYRGLPTGYFIQPINKGQYYQDLNDYKCKLLYCKGGIQDQLYNLKDDDGNYIFRDDNGEFNLQLNEYGDPIFPESPLIDKICKDYYRKIESWISDHAERRFTKQYYLERIDYLSPSTLRLLNEVQSKINSIRAVATVNGDFRPDMLTNTQLEDLSKYQQEYSELSNPYNIDGTLKDGDDVYSIAAKELSDWQTHMRGKLIYESDIDAYEKAKSHARDKRRFDELFSTITINPLLWKMIENENVEASEEIMQELNRLKTRRSKLLQYIKTDRFTKLNWDLIVDQETGELKHPEFWAELKALDSQIQITYDKIYNQDVQEDENDSKIKFNDLFRRAYLAADQNKDIAFKLDDSMFGQIIDGYRNYLKQQHPDWTDSKITDVIHDQFYVGDNPLSIFTIPFPKNVTQFQYTDGKLYPSIVRTPNRMFTKINQDKSDKKYLNENFDIKNPDYIQPKESIYKDYRYYEFINESKENKKLYDALIQTMKDSFAKLPFVRPYDYRLPQIGEDRISNIMMRNIHSRFGQNLSYFFKRNLNINETDVDIIQDGTVRRPDGSTIKHIPIRFIQMLEKPEYISSDVIGNVVQFYRMAENYRIKSKSASKLMSILDAVSENSPQGVVTNQTEAIRGMLDRQLYEDNTTGLGRNTGKKWKHFNWIRNIFGDNVPTALKRLQQFRSVIQGSMLKLNLSSALSSFFDPLTSVFINAVTAKYFGIKDLSYAFTQLLLNMPTAVISLGSTRTYNKINAAIQTFGITKDASRTFRRMDEGSFRRFMTDNLLMKGFEFGDYTLQTLNTVATLHAYKKYINKDGNVEYLSKYDYMNKAQQEGFTVKEAKKMYNRSASLYSQLYVDKKGNLKLKDKNIDSNKLLYKVGKQSRHTGSFLTGVVQDTSRTGLQSNIFTSFITMMRNFLIVGFWERFTTMRDFQVQSQEVVNPETGEISKEYSDIVATDEEKSKIKHEQVYYRGGFDFTTGRIENAVFNSAFSFISRLWPYLKYAITSIHTNKYDSANEQYLKEHNLNSDDVRYMQRTLLEISAIMASMLSSVMLNNLLKTKDPDDDDNYLLYLLFLLNLRHFIERSVWFVPSTVSDLITSITPASGGAGKISHLGDIMIEGLGLSKHKLDDPVKSGNYKDKSRLFYHTFNVGSIVGLHNWYTNMPKFLGGGGAYVLNQKARWYKKPIIGADHIYGEKEEKSDRKSSSVYKDPYVEQVNREINKLNKIDSKSLYGY